MRSEIDVLRSIKRYVSVVLGDAWEVRLWADQGSFAVPFARVVSSGGSSVVGGSAAFASQSLPVSVYCYLGESETEELAEIAGMGLRERLVSAFRFGGVANEGYPLRVPLYDYDGVDYPIGVGKRWSDRDFVRVADLNVARVAEDGDGRFVIVVATMQVSWSRAAALAADRIAGPDLQSVQVSVSVERQSQQVEPRGVGSGEAFGEPVVV